MLFLPFPTYHDICDEPSHEHTEDDGELDAVPCLEVSMAQQMRPQLRENRAKVGRVTMLQHGQWYSGRTSSCIEDDQPSQSVQECSFRLEDG